MRAMADQTFIACPHCGEPVVMTAMQQSLFRGRTLACVRCAQQFTVDPQTTPLFEIPEGGQWGIRPRPVKPPADQGATDAAPPPDAPASPAAEPTPQPQKKSGTGAGMIALLVIGGLLLVGGGAAAIFGPMASRANENARRVQCASNLQQLGVALNAYAATHRQYPDTLERLLTAGLIQPSILVCPASGDTPAPGSSPQVQIANLRLGGHLSYFYTGAGLGPSAIGSPTQILLYEPLSHHGPGPQGGINVLYANGAVSYITPPLAQQTVATLQAQQAAGGGTPGGDAPQPPGSNAK